jgi:hypothetical protein
MLIPDLIGCIPYIVDLAYVRAKRHTPKHHSTNIQVIHLQVPDSIAKYGTHFASIKVLNKIND